MNTIEEAITLILANALWKGKSIFEIGKIPIAEIDRCDAAVAALTALFRNGEVEARIDELEAVALSYGHRVAQTAMSGEVGKWLTVPERIAALQASLKEDEK